MLNLLLKFLKIVILIFKVKLLNKSFSPLFSSPRLKDLERDSLTEKVISTFKKSYQSDYLTDSLWFIKSLSGIGFFS